MKVTPVACPGAIARDVMHAFTKRLRAKGSGGEAPLKPTSKEGPHWRDAPRPKGKVQKSTNEEDPNQARRREADRSPLKPTNKEGPWREAKR